MHETTLNNFPYLSYHSSTLLLDPCHFYPLGDAAWLLVGGLEAGNQKESKNVMSELNLKSQ